MNRLANESSPYLRQHADNPVDWYPWGEEAFDAARQQDKPMLLSIGYSSCHWCHVMAHESFEDDATAAIMNELFVNVKVDREERPDVDAIYMEAVQAMSGGGGWPMTVFTNPSGDPFFAGTYFGPVSMQGRPSFAELMSAVDEAWRNQRSDLEDQATALREAIAARTLTHATDEDPTANGQQWLAHSLVTIEAAYDKEWGGFGTAPKFPQSGIIELLLSDSETLPMAVNSLDAMASGGIYDQLGGGFHRYSVDAFWMVPHFEKMLYDQALLARTYVDAYLVTGEQRFAQIATETIEYVLRDLAAPSGGWYSSQDADSEGEEGAYYIWRPEQIDRAVKEHHLMRAARDWYGVTSSGNFEGSNILHRPKRGDLLRDDNVEEARQLLLQAREQRVAPGLDDKVITEWNAMFLSTLSYAAGALRRDDWRDEAIRTAEFLLDTLSRDGRWLRVWHEKSGAKQLAYSCDYAWLVDAFARLGELTGRARFTQLATETADQMLQLFWDDEHGGLFTTGSDAEQLIVRSKDLFDGAAPSANSAAAVAMLRLGALTGRADMRHKSEAIVKLVAESVIHHPTAFSYLLKAVDLLSAPTTETVIAGDHRELVNAVHGAYLPRNVLAWGEPTDSPLWQERTDGAYVCRNYACNLPTTDIDQLLAQLES